MFESAEKNHVYKPHEVFSVQNYMKCADLHRKVIVTNCMKCADLHRKILFPAPNPQLDWCQVPKNVFLWITWNVIFPNSTPWKSPPNYFGRNWIKYSDLHRKNHVWNLHPLGRDEFLPKQSYQGGGKLPKICFARNSMKYWDLHWEIPFGWC